MPLRPELLAIVRCPKCLGEVKPAKPTQSKGLVCEKCRLLYPIVDEIPNFLVEEAKPI